MSNPIKYSTSAQTLALKKGNFWIGTGDVGKGPTSTTDYYNGITPPSGGYTIYLNKASGGPSIYTASNSSQLISLTNSIAGSSYTTAAQCLDYFAGQTDKMVFNIDYPALVTDGLIVNFDAGFTPSYPTTGTTWYDTSPGGNSNNGVLANGPTFNSSGGGSMVFDGTDDYAGFTSPSSLLGPTFTVCSVITPIVFLGNGTVVFTNESARLNLGIGYGGSSGGYFFIRGSNFPTAELNGVYGGYNFSYGTNTKYFVTWVVDIPGKNFQFWVKHSL
jgi:hypothetical protein